MVSPQILLLGNGLNRAFNGPKWEDGLVTLNKSPKTNVSSTYFSNVPYPLKAIIATEDQINTSLHTEKAENLLYGLTDVTELSKPITKLLSLGFDQILTTNYSYEIERILDCDFNRNGTHNKLYIRDFNKTTAPAIGIEKKFFLHTYNEIRTKSSVYKIWHVHGEGRKPDSVVLGHYLYGKLLGKYQEELKEKYKEINQAKQTRRKPYSWIDAFMDGDIYILGFGFDFSEFDLWWLLNEKKRNGSGCTIYYEPSEKEEGKHLLLNTLGVKTENLGYLTKPKDYAPFYEEAILDISKKMQGKRGTIHV